MEQTSIQIVKKLRSAGHKSYWAGGCVRDMLLCKIPIDYDIVTSATPDEIEQILEKTIPIGKTFGVIKTIKNGHHFEIATFRSDSGYSDGRRPNAIYFSSPKEDALRRDFTINGMFYDPIKNKIHDYIGGQKDLKARLIRFIGDPELRIKEDHLRILRGIRFKNQLDFQYHPDTYKAILKNIHLIKKVSIERMRDELNKMMKSPNRTKAIIDMEDTGLLKLILPEIQAMKGVAQPYQYHEEGDVFEHTMLALTKLPQNTNIDVIWATLLHDVGKPDTFSLKERIRFDGHTHLSGEITEKILRRLKFPRKQIKKITWLVKHHMLFGLLKDMPLGRKRRWLLDPWFEDLLQVHFADESGSIPCDLTMFKETKNMMITAKKNLPTVLPKIISGEDLIKNLKIEAGPKIGELLEKLYFAQLAEKITTKKEAIAFAKQLLNNESK